MKNKKSFDWTNPKLKARKTKNYGNGVFAEENIKRGEMLNIAGGYVMTIKEELKLPKGIRDSGLQISENLVLSGPGIETSSYFNHSCNPNAGFRGQMFLEAMRDIKKGEEITFDYAMCLYRTKGEKPYKFRCLCGAENCREYVTDNDWKIPELQTRYDGYFQYFLQDKINKLKKK
ncbi:MAG: SET domain-containing protein [Nitrospirota bacterium]